MKVVYRKRSLFYPVCFVIAVLLSAICFGAWNSGHGNIASSFVNVVVSPLQFAADRATGAVCELGEYFESHAVLVEENRQLKEEIKSLKQLESQNQILKNQNDALYGFLDLKRERSDFELVDASIIARTSSNYKSSFVIDRGTFHGVKENMPLINSDGVLLGVVVSADVASSKCLSLTSYDMNVGVYDEKNGSTGILCGDYELFSLGKCMIKDLQSQTNIAIGDRILTSGMGDVYPRGLVIGRVESLEPDMESYTLKAVVVPEATQLSEDSVMVITAFKRTYE